MEDFQKEVLQRLSVIEVKLDNVQKLEGRVNKIELDGLEDKKDIENLKITIKAMQESQKWLVRLISSSIIGAVITAVLTIL